MNDIVRIGDITRNITETREFRANVNYYLSYSGDPIIEIETAWTQVSIHVEDVDSLIDLLKKAKTYWEKQASLSVSGGNEREN